MSQFAVINALQIQLSDLKRLVGRPEEKDEDLVKRFEVELLELLKSRSMTITWANGMCYIGKILATFKDDKDFRPIMIHGQDTAYGTRCITYFMSVSRTIHLIATDPASMLSTQVIRLPA